MFIKQLNLRRIRMHGIYIRHQTNTVIRNIGGKFKPIIDTAAYIFIDLTMASSILSLATNFVISSITAIKAPETKPPM